MRTGFYLTCIFLCVPFLISARNIFHIADSLHSEGLVKDALLEYERVVFLSDDNHIKNQALYKKAILHKQSREFNDAQNELERISYFRVNDSLQFIYRYETALNAYLAGNFETALSQILQIHHFIRDTTKSKRVEFLHILVLNELMMWDEARELSLKYARSIEDKEVAMNLENEINTLYSKKNLPRLKKAKTARTLSFIPGLGQLYSGNIGEGLVSFTINLAFLTFGVYQVYHGYYFTGYFIGAGGLSSFFFGNLNRSVLLVKQRNEREVNEFNREVRDYILYVEEMRE